MAFVIKFDPDSKPVAGRIVAHYESVDEVKFLKEPNYVIDPPAEEDVDWKRAFWDGEMARNLTEKHRRGEARIADDLRRVFALKNRVSRNRASKRTL